MLCSITVQSQEQTDSIDQDLINPSYFYAGISTSLNFLLPNVNIVTGYNLAIKEHALALEYEIGRVYSAKNEWLNRLSLKFYPLIKINPRNVLVVGLGIQKFNFTKLENGLFARFDDNYRQEIDYSVYSQLRNEFAIIGVNDLISENIHIEVLSFIGYAKITGSNNGIPEDAVYIGNGSLFGPPELKENNRTTPTLDFRVSLTYGF